jgi:LPS-assembly protein
VTLAALAAAGLLARLCAAAPLAAPSPALPEGDVRIDGDVTYEPGTGRLLVENGAVLRRGAVTIRARSFTWDPASGEVRAAGGVLLTDPTRVVAADSLRAVVGGPWQAEGVVAFVKDQPVDLSGATAVEAARCAGRNRLSFSGARLDGDDEGAFTLDRARLTLCDCPGGAPPSWEVTARRADVRPGERAILSWPVLRVTPRFLFVDRPVPVLALPWLYVPLGERQTGLLLPEIDSVDATGFRVAAPLFVTLGRSADLTLTAEYAFGRDRADVAAPKPVAWGGLQPAVRGPGARLELRWAPAVGAEGSVELAWLHDLDAEDGGEEGDRFALEGTHAHRLSERTSLRAELRLAGDPVWVRDLTASSNARAVPYRRSDLLVSHRRDAIVLEGGASYLQPLRPFGVVDGEEYGTLGAGLEGASRLPALSATLLPAGAGPFRLSARTGVARYAPPTGDFDREGGRPAATRADGQVDVELPLLLGGAVSLAPWARGAAAAYAFETGRESDEGAWAVGGAVLATEVSRRFGALRHAIAPRLEWRAGTRAAGDDLDFPAYDALDRSGTGLLASGPAGPWSQLRAAVETRLSRGEADLLRLEVGQDYDVRSGRFAETFVTAATAAGRLSAAATARFLAVDGRGEPVPSAPASPFPASDLLDRFTELRASLAVADRRGDQLRAGFLSVGPGGSGLLVAGIDPLFDLRPGADRQGWATLGTSLVAGGARLDYDAQLYGRVQDVPTCSAGGGTRRVEGWQASQHAASVSWDSPCRCFRVAARASVNDCGKLSSLGVVLDLSGLGASRGVR